MKKTKQHDPEELASIMRRMNRNSKIRSDVQGSYTGTDIFDEGPVQDADDL
ncbi:MAG: hypothetical protein VB049_06785 [Candidatus Pelethousia sp.]|nr:hypothetical protein [Candidatus Pelethousia sp.]